MRQVSGQRRRHLRYVQRKRAKRHRKPGKEPRRGSWRGRDADVDSLWDRSLYPAGNVIKRAFEDAKLMPSGPTRVDLKQRKTNS